jgi:uncharacterized membrane protein YciS (DUF1049 family)
MKRKLFVLFGVLLLVSFVVALDEPSVGVGGEDVESIQGAIENYSPLDESGEVDYEKYKPFVTRAEIRIAAINEWLEENASWLKVVFGMVPSVSWLFVVNMWVWLMAFLILVLNANVFGVFSDFLAKKIDFALFEASLANVLGFVLFVMFLVLKVYYNIAVFIMHLIDVLWNYVLGIGFAVAVIALIALILLAVFASGFLVVAFRTLKVKLEEKKKKKLMKRQEEAVEVVEKVGEEVSEK